MISQRDKILFAVAKLEQRGIFPTAEDITVEAFNISQKEFALSGHPCFPDHHKVFWRLCGTIGLVGSGLLEKSGITFKVGKTGWLRLRKIGLLQSVEEDIVAKAVSVSLRSCSIHSWLYAKDFWGLTSTGADTADKVKKVGAALRNAVSRSEESGTFELSSGGKIKAVDVRRAANIHDLLVRDFGNRVEKTHGA